MKGFGAFLKTMSKRYDPIGDLARDFMYDIRVNGMKAGKVKTPSAFKTYLSGFTVCGGAYGAFEDAVKLWKETEVKRERMLAV